MTQARFATHSTVTPDVYDRKRQGYIEQRRLDIIDAALSAQGGVATVLELGAGAGSMLHALAQRHPEMRFIGIELDPALHAYALRQHRLGNVDFVQADAATLRLDSPADFAFSVDFIHHLADTPAAYRSIHSALRPGALWLSMEPNILHPYIALQQERMRRADVGEDHFRPRRELPRLRAAGFEIERRSYRLLFPGGVTPPPALRAFERAAERLPVLGGSVVLELRRL